MTRARDDARRREAAEQHAPKYAEPITPIDNGRNDAAVALSGIQSVRQLRYR
jgi:hypothetical protein